MKEKEWEVNLTVTVTMDELKKRIENLPENMVISVTMEDTEDAERKRK